MRFSDERYRRHVEQHELALRMLGHEVRNGTICACTGLSPHRVRALYTSYLARSESAVARHRGKAPRQLAFLLRSSRLRTEAAVLGGVLVLFGVLPEGGVGMRPSLALGTRLCEAYEMYTDLVGAPGLG